MNTNQSFKEFISLEQLANKMGVAMNSLTIAETSNKKSHLLVSKQMGGDHLVVATIQNKLKGSTPQDTFNNIANTDFSIGVPHNDEDLHCIIESSGSKWVTAGSFG